MERPARGEGTGSTEESPEYNGPWTGTCRRSRGDEPTETNPLDNRVEGPKASTQRTTTWTHQQHDDTQVISLKNHYDNDIGSILRHRVVT